MEEADEDGFVLLITDMSKGDKRFYPAYETLLVNNKELKYIKDDESVCTVRSVAYLAEGRLADFASVISDLLEELNATYVVCLATDREEFYTLFENCEEFVTPVFLEQPQAEVIILDDKRPSEGTAVKVEKEIESLREANER